MDEDFIPELSFTEIPQEFHSDLNKEPFTNCTFCGSDLKNSHQPYMIEKSMKKNLENDLEVTAFEYAICFDCSRKKMEAMSKESVQNIQNYMEENLIVDQLEEESREMDIQGRLKTCVATNKNAEDLNEYNIVGQFIGDNMIVGPFPILISAEIGDEIQELLSVQTKKEFDDFMDTITDVPPELKELFKTKRPLLV